MTPAPAIVVLEQLTALGHAVFERGDFNLNIVGIRSPERRAGRFDDVLVVAFKVGGVWTERRWPITTDPGTYYLEHPLQAGGTAILLPGQYRGAYLVGKHKGYPALVQDRPMRFARDGNRDDRLDLTGPVQEAVIGANIHAADLDPFDADDRLRPTVDRWSAACQVFQSAKDYREWWAIVKSAEARWGPRFTYTLIDG